MREDGRHGRLEVMGIGWCEMACMVVEDVCNGDSPAFEFEARGLRFLGKLAVFLWEMNNMEMNT